jgi:hypothetical protein
MKLCFNKLKIPLDFYVFVDNTGKHVKTEVLNKLQKQCNNYLVMSDDDRDFVLCMLDGIKYVQNDYVTIMDAIEPYHISQMTK